MVLRLQKCDQETEAYTGADIRVERACRVAHVTSAACSMGLAAQPQVINEISTKTKAFRHSGAWARFWFGLPVSNVGRRNVREYLPIPDPVKVGWENMLNGLLDSMETPQDEPRVLPFAPNAVGAWLDFNEKVEGLIGNGGRLAHIKDWGSKLPGAVARVAALMQLSVSGTDVAEIGLDAVQRAIALGDLMTEHALAAFALMGAAQVDDDAIAVLDWIKARGVTEFTRHEVHKALEGRFRGMDKLMRALGKLREWCVIGPEFERKNPGARSSRCHAVNPKVISSWG